MRLGPGKIGERLHSLRGGGSVRRPSIAAPPAVNPMRRSQVSADDAAAAVEARAPGLDAVHASQVPNRIDDYELGPPMGSGGAGTVYAAIHRDGTEAAAKLARLDSELPASLPHEAAALERVDSPHVVKLLSSGTTKTEAGAKLGYVITERLDPRSLHERIVVENGLAMEQAMHVVEKVCRGLADAHAKDVVHLDVKPANVLFELEGNEPKLVDFGNARIDGNAAHPREDGVLFTGTAGYAAPELIRGKDVGPKADTFAVARLAYEMLTGKPAFPPNTAGPVLIKNQPIRPSLIKPSLGQQPQLESVLALGMANNPADRPTVEQFAEWLRAASKGELPAEVEEESHRVIGRSWAPASSEPEVGSRAGEGRTALSPPPTAPNALVEPEATGAWPSSFEN